MELPGGPRLHFQQLHSTQTAEKPATTPRVMVWSHSMLTSSRMYLGLAQDAINMALAATGEPWTAVLVDNRCHGQSIGRPGIKEPHTVDSMADDLLQTLSWGQQAGRWGKPEVLAGHSIGGLVVLEALLRLGRAAEEGGPEWLTALGVPKQVWTLDSRTLLIPGGASYSKNLEGIMRGFTTVPQPMESSEPMLQVWREALASFGIQELPPHIIVLNEHMLKPNPSGPGLVRQFEDSALPPMIASYSQKDYRALIESPPPGSTIHVVRGLASEAWIEEDGKAELELLRAKEAAGKGVALHEMEGADHWIPITHKIELLQLLEAALTAGEVGSTKMHMARI